MGSVEGPEPSLANASYFTTTLGQAEYLNSTNPEKIPNEDTISGLIDSRAALFPDTPVLGEFKPPKPKPGDPGHWSWKTYNFQQLQRGSSLICHNLIASNILSKVEAHTTKLRVVALLTPSSIELIFHFLAFVRMGYAVLLIAPQLSAEQVVELCLEAGAGHIFIDRKIFEALQIQEFLNKYKGTGTPPRHYSLYSRTVFLKTNTPVAPFPPPTWVDRKCTAYIHHTSGTSTGIPKPIAQSHQGATSCLLQRPSPPADKRSQITTTPLYHGGIADLMRGINTNNLTWITPSTVPLTTHNLFNMLGVLMRDPDIDETMFPKYLSCVPYVLNVVSETQLGMAWLSRFEMVGVGGAPVDQSVGDKLVGGGVRLVSRYGSTEAGYMMNSFRDFEKEMDWDYLRYDPEVSHQKISFVEKACDADMQVDGDAVRYELIVGAAWPNLMKRNCPDRSYATSDLFVPANEERRKWKYVGRDDALIVLTSGKKYDPVPIEISIRRNPAVEKYITDVCIFVGWGKNISGIIIAHRVPPEKFEDFKRRVKIVVAETNAKTSGNGGSRHAWISEDLIIFTQALTLPRNAKGLVIRSRCMDTFETQIDEMYEQYENRYDSGPLPNASFFNENMPMDDEDRKTRLEDLVEFVGAVVRGIYLEWNTGADGKYSGMRVEKTAEQVAKDLQNDTDLFSYGIDSVMGVEIRGRLMKALNLDPEKFGTNIVFDQRNIRRLATHILSVVLGEAEEMDEEHSEEMDEDIMLGLVEKHMVKLQLQDPSCDYLHKFGIEDTEVLVLTGVTGSLGSHILYNLLRNKLVTKVRRIYCLIRASSNEAARARLEDSMHKRHLDTEGIPNVELVCLAVDFGNETLGLPSDIWENLRSEIAFSAVGGGTIIHAAWPVNFAARVESFEDQFAILNTLLSLLPKDDATHEGRPVQTCCPGRPRTKPKLVFVSSTASVTNYPTAPKRRMIPEIYSEDPKESPKLGYSQSKWITEKLCQSRKGQCIVVRVGQLCGDTRHGYWNETESWPLMFAAGWEVNGLPKVIGNGEAVYWLPTDIAANIVIEIAMNSETLDSRLDQVYHVTNPIPVHWPKIVHWAVAVAAAGKNFVIVPPNVWISMVKDMIGCYDIAGTREGLKSVDDGSEAAKKRWMRFQAKEGIRGLIGMWQQEMHDWDPEWDALKESSPEQKIKHASVPEFDVRNTALVSPTMRIMIGTDWKTAHNMDIPVVRSWARQPVTDRLMGKMVKSWEERGFL